MILIQGKGVSKGVVQGPIYFFQRASAAVSNAVAGDLEEEKRRLEEAKEKSMEQLNALADKAREEAGEDAAMLFETHAMFVEDEDFCDCMNAALEEQNCPPSGRWRSPGSSLPRCSPPWTTPICRPGPPTSRTCPGVF